MKAALAAEEHIPQGLKADVFGIYSARLKAPQQAKCGLAGDPAKPRPFKSLRGQIENEGIVHPRFFAGKLIVHSVEFNCGAAGILSQAGVMS